MARTRDDRGSTHVLEAVIVASIMVSAIAFVVTFQQPSPSVSLDSRTAIAQKAKDALNVLADTPVDSKFGSDALSAAIAKCLNKMCGDLTDALSRLTPKGGAYALYVSNGYDTYPVYVMGTPSGESVSATRDFEPRWSHTFVSTATDMVTPNGALLTYALPVFNSNVVSQGGSHLVVKVTGQRADGSDYVMIGSYATEALKGGDAAATSASLYFVDPTGGGDTPVAILNATNSNVRDITLRLKATQGTIPAETEVDVDLPRGWTGLAPANTNGGWTILAAASDGSGSAVGSTIKAKTVSSLTGTLDLHLTLTYAGDVLDYYPISAHASRGAYGTANLLLQGEHHNSAPGQATPLMEMTVPAPMGSGATGSESQWTLAAYVPVDPTVIPGQASGPINVNTITIDEQEGNAIFDSSTGAVQAGSTNMGGAWTSSGKELKWTSTTPVALDYGHLLNLTFTVKASGVAGPPDIRSAFTPPVTFDSWTGKLVDRSGWGFYRSSFLADDTTYHGYDPGVVGGPLPYAAEHPISSDGIYRTTDLNGTSTYNTSNVGSIEQALYGSYVEAEKQTVPVGGQVIINTDVQSLLFALEQAGESAGVTLRFYPPWAGDDRTPIFEQDNLDQGLLSGDITAMVMLDVNGDGIPDPVVGTSNGRVMAYDAVSGQRVQGESFTAPLTAAAAQAGGVASITTMTTMQLRGSIYVVVGTNENSNGVFVLRPDLSVAWETYSGNAAILSLDASTSFDGDDGPEIVAARGVTDTNGAKHTILYVYLADDAGSLVDHSSNARYLKWIKGNPPPTSDATAYYDTLGQPTTLVAQSRIGPSGQTPGVLVPTQSLLDPGVTIDVSVVPPKPATNSPSLPRAGLQSVDVDGVATSTLFGAPASIVKTYDYGPDHVDDALMGGASGYVILDNGTALTQPLYSYVLESGAQIIDADSPNSTTSYVLMDNGQALMTDDAWLTNWGPDTVAPLAKAIATDRFDSFWVVGSNNEVWRTTPVDPGTPGREHMPAYNELTPVDMGLPGATGLHELRDITFVRDPAHPDPLHTDDLAYSSDGWIVGAAECVGCLFTHQGVIWHTTDDGATWEGPGLLDGDLNKIKFCFDSKAPGSGRTGWIVGSEGNIYRARFHAGETEPSIDWTPIPLQAILGYPVTYAFHDIDCRPNDPGDCIVVGDAGAAFELTHAATDALGDIRVQNLTASGMGIPTTKPLYSVGFQNSERVYVGSQNAVLAAYQTKYDDGVHGRPWTNFTALPLNYVEADARVINGLGNGDGFIYGGTTVDGASPLGRIWLLHDYLTHSVAQTVDLHDQLVNDLGVPADTKIVDVDVVGGNVSLGGQSVTLQFATNAPGDPDNWVDLQHPLSTSSSPGDDGRIPIDDNAPAIFATGSNHLRARVILDTDGAQTIASPHVRELTFDVAYVQKDVPLAPPPALSHKQLTLHFDQGNTLEDIAASTADWNTTLHVLRQPLINETWVRNVSGQVYDINASFAVSGDSHKDIYVATGGILSSNSPDYAIYAGTDQNKFMSPDDRVYLLDGETGNTTRISLALDGEVRKIQPVADPDHPTGPPIALFAITWNSGASQTVLYSLDPLTLDERWHTPIPGEVGTTLGTSHLPNGDITVFVGTQRPTGAHAGLGHLRAYIAYPDHFAVIFRVIPDDLGKYNVRANIPQGWLFGPYVVEVEVTWKEAHTEGGVPNQIVKSARFYDHFMVTPPDLVMPPTPLYTAHLLVWMQDWG